MTTITRNYSKPPPIFNLPFCPPFLSKAYSCLREKITKPLPKPKLKPISLTPIYHQRSISIPRPSVSKFEDEETDYLAKKQSTFFLPKFETLKAMLKTCTTTSNKRYYYILILPLICKAKRGITSKLCQLKNEKSLLLRVFKNTDYCSVTRKMTGRRNLHSRRRLLSFPASFAGDWKCVRVSDRERALELRENWAFVLLQ